MEDRSSKKQWYKGGMNKDDYASSTNVIPNATAIDYVKCFRDSLECDLDDSGDVQRKLTSLKGDALRLRLRLGLAMSIRFLQSSWVAKYSFDLDPVSVDRIDILESKLRDQREELEQLREKVDDGTAAFIMLDASRQSNQFLLWKIVESADFNVNGEDGVVKFTHPGYYRVGITVNCAPGGYNQLIELLKNGACIQSSYCGYVGGNTNSVSLDAIIHVENEDYLSVRCPCSISGTSYMTLQLLKVEEVANYFRQELSYITHSVPNV
ncbi:hypothetical protein PHMEG_00022066 [Phytophthora megakarya]|uniref:Uncharacterized protein n=1 Tax=Phytophthora megakarya TaxID=4795 RepID=A0A225VL07_9STRA|nr:hypothetical protein PHMEG_00022066 [Phytophthora megakarya]